MEYFAGAISSIMFVVMIIMLAGSPDIADSVMKYIDAQSAQTLSTIKK